MECSLLEEEVTELGAVSLRLLLVYMLTGAFPGELCRTPACRQHGRQRVGPALLLPPPVVKQCQNTKYIEIKSTFRINF